MLNLAELMYAPEFSQSFTVYRRTGAWVNGVFTETETALTFTGIVTPASSKEIMQLPEGDRSSAVMAFRSDQEMYTTRMADAGESFAEGTSDQIQWRNDRYRVVRTDQWGDYGFYTAYGTYVEGY